MASKALVIAELILAMSNSAMVSFRHPVHVMILLLSYAAPLRAENKMACSLWGCISKYTTYMGLVKAKNLYLVYKIF